MLRPGEGTGASWCSALSMAPGWAPSFFATGVAANASCCSCCRRQGGSILGSAHGGCQGNQVVVSRSFCVSCSVSPDVWSAPCVFSPSACSRLVFLVFVFFSMRSPGRTQGCSFCCGGVLLCFSFGVGGPAARRVWWFFNFSESPRPPCPSHGVCGSKTEALANAVAQSAASCAAF
uniref:Uncharacterized protein n=1 Tax=Ixodes ricinus TaxID=34613 RepID=A0A6B0UYW5_IXORI